MPFDAQKARAAGYTDTEIADHLAKQSSGFDIDGARKAGYTDAQLVVFLSEKDPTTGQPRATGMPSNQDEDTLRQRRVDRAREVQASQNNIFEGEINPAAQPESNYLSGIGKSFVDTGRGIKQIGAEVADAVAPRQRTVADLVSGRDPSRAAAVTSEIDEARRLDQPLMRTGAGTAGTISGLVAQTIPTMFIPGVNTIAGSTALGGALGATQPVGTGESRLKNTAVGAGAGFGGTLLARGVGATVRGAKALTEPFTQAGRERIAGRTLERFGVQPADVAGATNAPTATGARTTLAEQIQRPEGAAAAARLQDSVRAANPEVAASMAARDVENNAARVAMLQQAENMGGRRAIEEGLRAQTAKVQYDAAFKRAIDPAQLSAAERGEYTKVFNLPAVKDALKSATQNLRNKGMSQKVPMNNIETLHEAKLAMDQRLSELATKGSAASSAEAQAVTSARDRLVSFIEKHSHEYADARRLYAEMSQPINQADIAGEVLRRGSSATTDLAGNPVLQAGKLTGAVRDEGKLVKAATGRDLGDLSDVMTPKQLQDIQAVVGEVDRAAAVARAGNGPGSATAQRLAGTNIIEQVTKGLGLPDSTAASTVVQEWLARPLNFLFKGSAEPKLQATLGEIILNPQLASKAMAAASPAQRAALSRVLSNKYLEQSARASLPAASQSNRR